MEQARRSRRPTSDEEHTFELPHLGKMHEQSRDTTIYEKG